MATQVAAPATPVGLTASSQTVDKGVLLMLAAFVLVPASFVPLAIAHGGALVVVPYQHFSSFRRYPCWRPSWPARWR